MTERGILFSAPMVKAILDGRKSQTRRVTTGAPAGTIEVVPSLLAHAGDLWDFRPHLDNPRAIRCPYGAPAGRLWVRETWTHDADSLEDARAQHEDAMSLTPIYYRAGMPDAEADTFPRWRPSIFMPRWASRITLEVTEVRVQRLQEISEDDARAEGVHGPHYGRWTDMEGGLVPPASEPARPWAHSFAVAWQAINGKRATWWSNPWVWAISFRRLP